MRVVIMVEGGLVQEVYADEKLDYIIIDSDKFVDGDEACDLLDTSGHSFTGTLTEYETVATPETVEHYWNQIPAM